MVIYWKKTENLVSLAMIERREVPNVSRRDLLKLSGVAFAGIFFSKEILELDQDFQNNLEHSNDRPSTQREEQTKTTKELKINREKEPGRGLRIIDNTGVEKNGQLVDVVVDETLIKENILSRTRQMISPEYYPKVEAMVNDLVISFGARPYSKILETALSQQNPLDSKKSISLKAWFINRLNSILNLGVDPNGATFRDTEDPLIFINTGQILEEEITDLNTVWDHETAHLIYNANPENNEAFWQSTLERIAIHASIMPLMSIASTTVAYAAISKKRGIDLKTFILRNKDTYKKNVTRGMRLLLIPTLFISQIIHYEYFNDSEILARNAAKDLPTPPEYFSRMIRVVPHDSTSAS